MRLRQLAAVPVLLIAATVLVGCSSASTEPTSVSTSTDSAGEIRPFDPITSTPPQGVEMTAKEAQSDPFIDQIDERYTDFFRDDFLMTLEATGSTGDTTTLSLTRVGSFSRYVRQSGAGVAVFVAFTDTVCTREITSAEPDTREADLAATWVCMPGGDLEYLNSEVSQFQTGAPLTLVNPDAPEGTTAIVTGTVDPVTLGIQLQVGGKSEGSLTYEFTGTSMVFTDILPDGSKSVLTADKIVDFEPYTIDELTLLPGSVTPQADPSAAPSVAPSTS